MEGRYKIYGVVANEHSDGNPDLDPDNQVIGGTIPIYATDDSNEALMIVREGGFLRGELWCAAQWAEDTVTGNRVGDVPV